MRKVQCKFDSLAVGNHLYRAWRDRFFFFFYNIQFSHFSVESSNDFSAAVTAEGVNAAFIHISATTVHVYVRPLSSSS